MSLGDAYEAVREELIDGVDDDHDLAVELDPKDLKGANKHLRAIARYTHDRDDFIEVAEGEIAELQRAIDEARAHAEVGILFHAAVLERFHRAILEKFPNRLSIKLPGGDLTSEAQQPEWTFLDEFVAWCLANDREDLLLDEKPAPARAPDKKAAKAALTQPVLDDDGKEIGRELGKLADGTEVPGVTVVERGRKFGYKLRGRE